MSMNIHIFLLCTILFCNIRSTAPDEGNASIDKAKAPVRENRQLTHAVKQGGRKLTLGDGTLKRRNFRPLLQKNPNRKIMEHGKSPKLKIIGGRNNPKDKKKLSNKMSNANAVRK